MKLLDKLIFPFNKFDMTALRTTNPLLDLQLQKV